MLPSSVRLTAKPRAEEGYVMKDMYQQPEFEERKYGWNSALQLGYRKTAALIADRSHCYTEIMNALAEEAGIETALAHLETIGYARWAYRFARHVAGLTPAQHNRLIAIVTASGSIEYATWYFEDVADLTEDHLSQLRAAALRKAA